MAETEFNAQFFEQFLDDYFAEADDHLLSVRRHLLAFEDSLEEGSAIPAPSLNELFRSFHTLKGISAMANVSAAETLAHYMENYLRLLREGLVVFSNEGLEALLDSTKKLELIVAARKDGEDSPDIGAEVDQLERLNASTNIHESGGESKFSAAETAPGDSLFKFIFEPSAEAASRDINVNSVRGRLEALGTIRDTRPVIKDGGKIAFEFIVAGNCDPELLTGWAADGITCEKLADEVTEDLPSNSGPAMPESANAGLLGQSNVVRVELARLDELMLMVGDLVISRARLVEQIKLAEHYLPSERERGLHEINQTIEKQLRSLRDGIMRVRMVPIGEVFERMQFVARDLARESDKRIRLEITGEKTEIDKLLVERMIDPLLHLVRNAISHGIEPAEERNANGKPADGTISLDAGTIGESVIITIADDGRGIDREAVRRKALERGLLQEDSEFDDETLLEVLCTPGFSTKIEADKTSGRGVGMDVVKRVTEALGGNIFISTEVGWGTTFTIRLPLTLAIADALIVEVDQERYAVPQSAVREILQIEQNAVTKFENNEVVEYRGEAMPLVDLAKRFDLRPRTGGAFHACVVDHGKQTVGIAVDRVLGQREIVIRAINDPLLQVADFSGATELGDGRAVLILNVPEIVRG